MNWSDKFDAKVKEILNQGGQIIVMGVLPRSARFMMPNGVGIAVDSRGIARVWDEEGRSNGPDD